MSLANPSPKALSYFSNLGSLLGMVMVFQILTGLLLTFIYTNSTAMAYFSIMSGEINTSFGWLAHLMHSKLASLLFLLLYLHIFKHLIYGSQRLNHVWLVGGLILFMTMAAAFLGYSLTYSDMSYWAATVITNLLSVVPFIGDSLVVWFRTDYFVGDGTLKFFFALHFLLPFIILVLVMAHVISLHQAGSSSKIGKTSLVSMKSFSPFLVKDMLNLVLLVLVSVIVLLFPYFLTDASAFVTANTMKSPAHIQPEWYFLMTYALLRSSSHKSLAVLYLLFVMVLWVFFIPNFTMSKSALRSGLILVFGYLYLFTALHLTYLGSCTMEAGYVLATSLASIFLGFLSLGLTFATWL